jgi:hypothetical protein
MPTASTMTASPSTKGFLEPYSSPYKSANIENNEIKIKEFSVGNNFSSTMKAGLYKDGSNSLS